MTGKAAHGRMPGRRGLGIVLFLAGLAWALGSCGQVDPRPNVVILLVDTLRPDRLGCYGYALDTSPALDSLAARGTVFTRCYAPSDYTPASTASLFTGCYPLAHGYVNADYGLEEAQLTLAEILREQGYRTAGFTANGLAGRKYRMDQGFDEFFEKNRASAEELGAAVEDFIRRCGTAPFFAYVHFMDVHDPYRIPAGWQDRFAAPGGFAREMQDTLRHEEQVMRAWWEIGQQWRDSEAASGETRAYFADYGRLYDAAIAYWDAQLRRLDAALNQAGVGGRTILVVTADHGEQLLEHGFFGHGNSGYDVGLQVPLVIRDPTRQAGVGRVESRVGLVDLLPILLVRLGVEVPDHVQGKERWSLLEGEEKGAEAGDQRVYTEGTFFANRPFSTLIQTYREGRWKLVLDRFRDVKELFDLERDPGEQVNRFDAEPEVAARLTAGLRQRYHENLARFVRQDRSERQQEEEKLRELKALGYLSSRSRSAPRIEFFPMQLARLEAFGPFGDEEDLARFGDRLDFARGQVVWGQVIRGYSDQVGRADSSGCWFDCRSTFLLRHPGAGGRAVFEVNVVPDRAGRYPTRIELEFDDRVAQVFAVDRPGPRRLEGKIPAAGPGQGYFYGGLRANHRFVLRGDESPRTRVYGALKIRSVHLERAAGTSLAE